MDETQTDSLTKKERNELNRIEKQKVQEQAIRIKKIKSWIPWIAFVAVVVGGIYWAAISAQKSNEARPGESVSIVSREHINIGDSHEQYNSNPPTSGPHAGPAPWGFSEQEIADENAIHNLEHGGIWISYKDLDDQSVEILRDIARKNSQSGLVTPRADNDSSVAVASWGRLMEMDNIDEQAIAEFIRKNKNKSPEPLAI